MSRESRRFPLPSLPARRDPVPDPAAAPAPTHRCRRRSCGWQGSRNRRRDPYGGRRGRVRCRARPAAWRIRGSSRSRRAPGRRRRGRWGPAPLRTGTARCTPGPEPPASAGGDREREGGVRAAARTARTGQARRAAALTGLRRASSRATANGAKVLRTILRRSAACGWRGGGVGLPGGEGSRGEPRASRRADLLGGADGAAADDGRCAGGWLLGAARLRSPPLGANAAGEWLCDCRAPDGRPFIGGGGAASPMG